MDPAEFFTNVWTPLCRRFGKDLGQTDEAALYLEYLNARLSEEQIRGAARALWATREFFPRPADFVLAAHAGVLRSLRSAAQAYTKDNRAPWLDMIGGRDSLGHQIVQAIGGGIGQIQALADRGAHVLRQEVDEVMNDLLLADGREPSALLPPAPSRARALSSGDPVRASNLVQDAMELIRPERERRIE